MRANRNSPLNSALTKRIFVLLALTGVMLISLSQLVANDTLARVPVRGGLEFVKSENIRMVEEDLEISLKRIRVKYRFLNESDQDISSTVAFRLPAHNLSEDKTDRFPDKETDDRFLVLVNGDPVQTKKIENAQTWRQTFPAGKEMVVEHSYGPNAGGEYDYIYQMNRYTYAFLHTFFFWVTLPSSGGGACIDRSTARAIKKRVEASARGGGTVAVFARDIEYILGTGRNWKGPIGKFVLRIEKESPDHFVAVCFPESPKQVSPTVSEYVQTDFVPPDKLIVFFYRVSD
jgi:hypothetical protein